MDCREAHRVWRVVKHSVVATHRCFGVLALLHSPHDAARPDVSEPGFVPYASDITSDAAEWRGRYEATEAIEAQFAALFGRRGARGDDNDDDRDDSAIGGGGRALRFA